MSDASEDYSRSQRLKEMEKGFDWETFARRERLTKCSLERERDLLRQALVRYGDRSRMGNVEPSELQQVIDDAFAVTIKRQDGG